MERKPNLMQASDTYKFLIRRAHAEHGEYFEITSEEAQVLIEGALSTSTYTEEVEAERIKSAWACLRSGDARFLGRRLKLLET